MEFTLLFHGATGLRQQPSMPHLELRGGIVLSTWIVRWKCDFRKKKTNESSSPVPLKTRRVGQRCTLNLSRAETSSRWCGVVVRRGGASSGVVHVTDHGFQNYVVRRQSPRVAEQCDVNLHSLGKLLN
ncbi:uncharacterized protein TNCV_1673481 [Trichonephila clavipes]|nr:uncharacterized protein TNCV_1673481 [Trichonephila clavipes]